MPGREGGGQASELIVQENDEVGESGVNSYPYSRRLGF